MNLRAYPCPGASRFFIKDARLRPRTANVFQQGFTLLEICIVFLIMAVLLGVMIPAIQSAFVENAVRTDGRQLTLMVRTAMVQSGDQHRTYVIDLTGSSIDLHAVPPPKPIDDDKDQKGDAVSTPDPNDDVDTIHQLAGPNKFFIPDPRKRNGWVNLEAMTWVFKPGDLCPAGRIRLVRGRAWMEMSFNALTGNVEDEETYFP